jgi:hypothetical protein
MKKLLYLVVGVVLGFAVAHVVSRNPSGKKFFDNLDAKAHEFGTAVMDGYRGREAELRAAASDVESALEDLGKRV